MSENQESYEMDHALDGDVTGWQAELSAEAAPAVITAAVNLLRRLDNITTDDFARGGERAEREELRRVLALALGCDEESVTP